VDVFVQVAMQGAWSGDFVR